MSTRSVRILTTRDVGARRWLYKNLKEDLHLAIGNGKIDWKKFMEYREEYFPKASVLIEAGNAKTERYF